jgi:MFS transporter, FSR family, fosmidomycin resistance protein
MKRVVRPQPGIEQGARQAGCFAQLGACALAHAGVDGTCGALLFHELDPSRMAPSQATWLLLLYLTMGLGIQPFIGVVADRVKRDRLVAVTGAVLTATAALVAPAAGGLIPSIALVGLGNSVFHVGAGALSLQLTPARASGPAIFVAPGAAGLALGSMLGRSGLPVWPFAVVLLGFAAALGAVLHWTQEASPPSDAPGPRRHVRGELALALLFFVIATRAFLGLALKFPWSNHSGLALALMAAVVVGKIYGGVLADRFGHVRLSVGALIVAGALLAVAGTSPVIGIVGMLAFNMTMPVTLVAIAEVLAEHRGFAFGLPCLMLMVGSLPALAGASLSAGNSLAIVAIIASSAGALFVALKLLEAPTKSRTHTRFEQNQGV